METALKEAGTCGRFQVWHVIFTQLPRFVTVWGLMIMMFGSYDPGWRCKDRAVVKSYMSSVLIGENGDDFVIFKNGTGNMTYPSDVYMKSTTSDSTQRLTEDSRHEMYQPGYNSTKLSNQSNQIGSINSDYSYNDTCDVIESCRDVEPNPASITIVSQFRLVCDRKWIVRVILLVMSCGFLTGALLGGQIGEQFGRKVSLYGGALIMCVSSGIAIFSYHWVMYTVCLFFIGVGGNVIQSTSSIFSMEFLNSKWRSIFGSIPTWNISLCVFTLTTALIKSWVHVHIVTCVLSFGACVGYFVTSESVRWLVVHGRYDRAEKVIQKVARINRKPAPTTETLLKVKKESNSNNNNDNSNSILCNNSEKNVSSTHSSTTYTYLHLFKTKDLSILSIKFSSIFFVVFITYFALSFGVNSLPGDFYVNAIGSSVCEIIIVVITGPLCNKIGRRWGGVCASILGGVSCFGIVIALYTLEGEVQSTTIKTCAFLARSGSMAISVVATIFMVELFPTAVRNVAFGLLRAMAGLGGLVGPFLIPDPGRDSFAICFSVMALSFVCSLFIFLSLSETNKLCLVDRIEDSKTRTAEEEHV